MRNLITGLVLIVGGMALTGCDGFTRKIEVDYSDLETKGVLIGVLSNSDDRDSVFRGPYDYSSSLKGPHDNRIYVSNSRPPGWLRDLYYNAQVHLESEGRELPLTFVDMDDESYNYSSYFGVEENLVPGRVYEVYAEFDPESAPMYVRHWSPVSARDTMPSLVEFTVRDIHLEYDEGNYWATPTSGYIDIQLKDEENRTNMYLIDVSASFESDTLYPNDDQFIVQGSIDRPDRTTDLDLFFVSRNNLFHEEDFTPEGNKRIHFRFRETYGSHDRSKGATLFVRVSNLSNNYIHFQQSSQQYDTNRENPFAEPVEIYTNVKNGYGIFALMARNYVEVKVN